MTGYSSSPRTNPLFLSQLAVASPREPLPVIRDQETSNHG
jgi:hypothetical protein